MSIKEEGKEARRRYMREWRRRNPDKVKMAQKRYWERRARREGKVNVEREGMSSTVKG